MVFYWNFELLYMANMHSILSDFNMSFTYHMKNLVKVIYLSYEKLSEVL